jgi:hypothetical protein
MKGPILFILNADFKHFGRTMECIVNSAPTSELVNTLLEFNPWLMESSLKISTIFLDTPLFLPWLESQASHELSLSNYCAITTDHSRFWEYFSPRWPKSFLLI